MRNAPRTVRALSHYQANALGEGASSRYREEGREGSVRTRTPWRPRRAAAAILVIALVTTGAVLASSASATSHGNVTLRVDLFGDFGYHDLYKQFEKTHPGVTIKEDIESYADHHANLAKHLATGAGADDVVAIEVGFISQFKSEPQYFYDLNQFGASKLKSQWLPWKWAQSIAPNGAQIGLGTDVGSMGICYRRDLMQAAGLPTARDQVSKLWPTWADYIRRARSSRRRPRRARTSSTRARTSSTR